MLFVEKRRSFILSAILIILLVAVALTTATSKIAYAGEKKCKKTVIIVKTSHRNLKAVKKVAYARNKGLAKRASCKRDRSKTQGQKLLLRGSWFMKPLAEDLGREFAKKNKDVNVIVKGGDSTAGIKKLGENDADIAMSSRDLKPEEAGKGLVSTKIGYDAFAIIVNKKNPVSALTKEQVTRIFSGDITNWKDVGGDNATIFVNGLSPNLETNTYFVETFMKDKAFIKTIRRHDSVIRVGNAVNGNPYGIGYFPLQFAKDIVKPLTIDGNAPTFANIVAGKYPYVLNLNFVTKNQKSDLVKAFIDFTLSNDGQRIVAKHGFALK